MLGVSGQKLLRITWLQAAAGGIVMLGPEGGFVPFEVELAQAQGARPVHIGARILSVDTAVTAALSQTMVRVG